VTPKKIEKYLQIYFRKPEGNMPPGTRRRICENNFINRANRKRKEGRGMKSGAPGEGQMAVSLRKLMKVMKSSGS